MNYKDFSSLVGNTPCVRFHSEETGNADVYIKLEGCNPTGSIKDRSLIGMLKKGQEDCKLKKGVTLLDASSGNFACSMAYFGKILGHKVEVVVSSKLTKEKKEFIEYYGANLIQVGVFTFEGTQYCRKLIEKEPDKYYFLDQLHSWENPAAHYKTTAPEILSLFPDIKAVVGSLGTGGSMCGISNLFKEKKPSVKIVAVQSASGTKIPGTGSFDDGDYLTPFIKKGIYNNYFDAISKIEYSQAVKRTVQLRDRGFFCGIQTGAVLHAALEQINEHNLKGDVVVISGDSGWKNVNVLMNDVV